MWKQICIPSDTGYSLKVYRFASAPFRCVKHLLTRGQKEKNRKKGNERKRRQRQTDGQKRQKTKKEDRHTKIERDHRCNHKKQNERYLFIGAKSIP